MKFPVRFSLNIYVFSNLHLVLLKYCYYPFGFQEETIFPYLSIFKKLENYLFIFKKKYTNSSVYLIYNSSLNFLIISYL